MLTIDWIRHTTLQIDGSYAYGQTDVPVSTNFVQEATLIKSALSDNDYDAVYTSPLSRAKKLAHYCGFVSAIEDPRIMEINLGDWEMKPWDELIQYDDLNDWFNNFHTLTPPNGENVQDLLSRIYDFIQDMRLQRHSRIAVFCHGGVINSARYLNQEIEKHRIFRDVPMYGSITSIKYAHIDQRPLK